LSYGGSKRNAMVDVSFTLDFKLPVHQAVAGHALGIDSAVQWRLRGLSGHAADRDDRDIEVHLARLAEAQKTLAANGLPEKYRTLVDRALTLLREHLAGIDIVGRHFPGKRFVFVLGMPRTGGTLLFTELCRAHGIDHEALDMDMVHDSIPTYDFIFRALTSPTHHLMALFEFCQFLAYCETAFAGRPAILQKRIAYGHWLPQLDALIGPSVTYLVTVRHPLPSMASFFEMTMGDGTAGRASALRIDNRNAEGWYAAATRDRLILRKDWFGDSSAAFARQFLGYWEAYYTDVARYGRLRGTMETVAFGPHFAEYLDAAYPGYVSRVDRNRMRGSGRDYRRIMAEFSVNDADVRSALERVRDRWALWGRTFPDLALL
jgi:hypothetical protein